MYTGIVAQGGQSRVKKAKEMSMRSVLRWVALLVAVVFLLGGCSSPGTTVQQTTMPSQAVTPSSTGTATPPAKSPAPTSSGSSTVVPSASGDLQVHFIDVGQGDSILIQSPDGKTMLIDGGERSPGVVSYLNKLGVKLIDVIVATHPHSDHIGGLVEVLQRSNVGEVWINGQPHTTKVFEDFLIAIDKSGAKYHEAKRGEVIELGAVRFQVLHPGPALVQDMNGNSIVLRLAYGDISFLFMGDANFASEADMLAARQEVKATVLKVGHHGSATSSSTSFLKAVAPQVAVYSAGRGNSYGHPTPQAIARLRQTGTQIYGTDVNGTIKVTTNGKTLDMHPDRQSAATIGLTPQPSLMPLVIPAPVVPGGPASSDTGLAASTAAPASGPPSATATPASAPSAPSNVYVKIISVTSPARRGGTATLTAETVPGASCTITARYKSGPSTAAGLIAKTADSTGKVSWTWNVGTRTTPGSWPITVTATTGGQPVSETVYFTVQ